MTVSVVVMCELTLTQGPLQSFPKKAFGIQSS